MGYLKEIYEKRKDTFEYLHEKITQMYLEKRPNAVTSEELFFVFMNPKKKGKKIELSSFLQKKEKANMIFYVDIFEKNIKMTRNRIGDVIGQFSFKDFLVVFKKIGFGE